MFTLISSNALFLIIMHRIKFKKLKQYTIINRVIHTKCTLVPSLRQKESAQLRQAKHILMVVAAAFNLNTP